MSVHHLIENTMNILIIEDDHDIAELIAYNLKQEKINSEICSNGSLGLNKAKKINPDLIILDLMLPDIEGLEISRLLKQDQKTKHIPILMLTAKSEEIDRIVGFEVGADDYLTKPFSPRELVLRVKAIARRLKDEPQSQAEKQPASFGLLFIDPQKFEVRVNNKEIKLTAIEFKLLEYLLSTKGRVATRDILLDRVWGYYAAITTRTVDTTVKRLREKIGEAGDYIETIRGIGYRFKERP